jgi:hypothetical protein
LTNIFLACPHGPEVVCRNAVRRVLRAVARGLTVVAMGKKVQVELERRGIAHAAIVHPAARGRIREKSRYAAHVQEVLCPVL